MRDTDLIYGERIIDLIPALRALNDGMTRDPAGGYRISALLEPPADAPLRRALARAEAELILEEADRIGTRDEIDRTHEQRAGDALVRVLTALA
jgi:hypothetical protein